jgi:hypothetical protein
MGIATLLMVFSSTNIGITKFFMTKILKHANKEQKNQSHPPIVV